MRNTPFIFLLLFSMSALLLLLSREVSPVWYDDAGHFLVAREVARQGVDCYPVAEGNCHDGSAYVTMGPALTWLLAGWMEVFGHEMSTARILMVILSLVSLFSTGMLANAILDNRTKSGWAVFMVLGNIQWVTYGSELLGEVPMLGWFFLGLWSQIQWIRSKEAPWVILSIASWFMALMTKEYILFPLGLGLLAWFGCTFWPALKKYRTRVFLHGFVLLTLYLIFSMARAGGWSEMWAYMEERRSYGSEFLAFDVMEGLRYLAFKPLIVLGSLALIIKVRVRRAPVDIFMLCMQGALIVFFLASAGYDRFGFQLIPISAIYFSEFVLLAFNRWVKGNTLRFAFAVLVLIAFAWQQTLVRLPAMLFDGVPTNHAEHAILQKAESAGAKSIFTFDQQIAPFVEPSVNLELFATVPSNARNCVPHQPKSGQFFIEGDYGRTIFRDCINRSGLLPVDSVDIAGLRYTLYRQP